MAVVPNNYLSCRCCSSGHFVNLLLGYTYGLNLAVDLGPVLALFLVKMAFEETSKELIVG